MKMKNLPIVLFFYIIYSSVYSQFDNRIILDADATGITEIIFSDLTNDNLKDIIISQKYTSNNMVSFYQNNGDGTFSSRQTIASEINFPPSVATGDLNSDGWNDILTASASTNESYLVWVPNNLGSFDAPIEIDSDLFMPVDFKISDIDNDNDLDIIAIGDTSLSIYKNDGTGNFDKNVIPPGISTEYYDLTLSDINNDGLIDAIIGGVKTLIYINNNGTLVYDSVRSDSIVNQGLVFLVETADFNNDGHPDILIGGENQSNLSWYENNGNGIFSLGQIIETNAVQCTSVSLNDFNEDGNTDVFTALPQEGKIVWYQNLGNGNFDQQTLVHQGVSPFTKMVCSGDINNDNKIDIFWSEPLSYHLNDFVLNIDNYSEKQQDFKIYPNPMSSNIINFYTTNRAEIMIFNSMGQLVFKTKVNKGHNSVNLQINSGIYTVFYRSDLQTSYDFFIKE